LPAAFAVAMSATQAQTPQQPQHPQRAAAQSDPLDASVAVPPLVYRSTLSTYRRLGDDKPVSWREANDNVARIGGWRAYAREASEPMSTERNSPASTSAPLPALPASAPSKTPMPAGHGGDKMH
jgi:hypothetical protein